MKTVYILTHIHQNTNIVGTFTDLKKALVAMDKYSDFVKSGYGILKPEQEQDEERQYDWQRNLKNGHIVKLEESKLFTDIEQFRKMILE